jgi:hypothetical protein
MDPGSTARTSAARTGRTTQCVMCKRSTTDRSQSIEGSQRNEAAGARRDLLGLALHPRQPRALLALCNRASKKAQHAQLALTCSISACTSASPARCTRSSASSSARFLARASNWASAAGLWITSPDISRSCRGCGVGGWWVGGLWTALPDTSLPAAAGSGVNGWCACVWLCVSVSYGSPAQTSPADAGVESVVCVCVDVGVGGQRPG